MGTPVYSLPISAAALREVDIIGVFRYAHVYSDAIAAACSAESRAPDLRKLITHRFKGLEEAEKAFQTAAKTKDDLGNLILKVMIVTDGDQTTEDDRR